MRCINCGNEISDDTGHCRICGTIYKREQKRTHVGLWIVSGVLAFAAGAFVISFMDTKQNVLPTQIVFEKTEIEPIETTEVTVTAEVTKDVEPEVTPAIEIDVEAQDAVNHDLEQSEELVGWEKQIFEDRAEFSGLQIKGSHFAPEGSLETDDFVRVRDYIPELSVELKYATKDNFTGEIIYDFTDAYLRYGTVKKLMQIQDDLEEYGYSLKIWDAFRPIEAQYALWEVCPNSAYVANPNKGYSSHSKGNTVDITLVDESGAEVEMPTGFDDFSKMADRDYSDCTQQAKENALILEEIMSEHGFKGYSAEWWHYTDTDAYSVEKEFLPKE